MPILRNDRIVLADHLGAGLVSYWGDIQQRADLLMHASIYQWAAKQFGPGWVLDLGCETGVGLRLLASANEGIDVFGCDVDLTSLRASTPWANGDGASRIQADGALLPIGSNTLSGLCLVNVVHLVQHPGHILREGQRVLRPGGRMVVSVPTRKLPIRWDIRTLTAHLEALAERCFGDVVLPEYLPCELTGDGWEVGTDADLYMMVGTC
jgi:SAM-dependent methyltransferase